MTNKSMVIKEFTISDNFNGPVTLNVGSLIEYERFVGVKDNTNVALMRIFFDNIIFTLPDFIIEGFVQDLTEPLSIENLGISEYIKQMREDNEGFRLGYEFGKQGSGIIQIQRLESVHDTNKFLSNIKKENVVDIKPMENNTYLVIYTKEDEE